MRYKDDCEIVANLEGNYNHKNFLNLARQFLDSLET